ncbi:MAG: HD domain-containing protein [Ignavibacteriales bacterium]|nr:HD domain-containing protein [Ignavibacteriales bacterium]
MINDQCTNIADNLHGIISISEFEKKVISTTIFNRLHNIHQNSTAYLTYPANRTKRFEHSLGTMFLCSKIFFHAIANADADTVKSFFTEAEKMLAEIKKIIETNNAYSNKLFKMPSKINDFFNQKMEIQGGIYSILIPSNVQKEHRWIYCILLEAVRISALLHDIGHPPFSHITESSIKQIYETHKEIIPGENSSVCEFRDIVKCHVDGGKQLHEEIGKIVTKNLFLSVIEDKEPGNDNDEDYSIQLFRIVVGELVLGIFDETNSFLKDLHRIVDGTLDGDRLDYISRDPINSGLDVGKIEYERLLNSIKLLKRQNNYLFCPSIKVINTIDNFFLRRLDMYKNIIFHHRVVKTDYLLKDTVYKLSCNYLSECKDLDNIHSDVLPYNISGVWKSIKNSTSEYEFSNKIIQWDDAWLMTVLKKHYFDKTEKKGFVLENELKELLTNEKSYYSVIKKKQDYYDIDNSVANALKTEASSINSKITNLREEAKASKDGTVDVEKYLQLVEDVIKDCGDYANNSNILNIGGPILSKISRTICVSGINPLTSIIDNALEKIKDAWKNNFEDVIIINKELSSGINEALYVYKNNNDLVKYLDISNASIIIKNDINYFTRFYIYVLVKKGVDKKEIDYEGFRRCIGEEIGSQIVSSIYERFDTFKINIES